MNWFNGCDWVTARLVLWMRGRDWRWCICDALTLVDVAGMYLLEQPALLVDEVHGLWTGPWLPWACTGYMPLLATIVTNTIGWLLSPNGRPGVECGVCPIDLSIGVTAVVRESGTDLSVRCPGRRWLIGWRGYLALRLPT